MASMADKSFSRRGLGIPAEAGRSFSPGRLWALVKKEFLQIKRDSSTFLTMAPAEGFSPASADKIASTGYAITA